MIARLIARARPRTRTQILIELAREANRDRVAARRNGWKDEAYQSDLTRAALIARARREANLDDRHYTYEALRNGRP